MFPISIINPSINKVYGKSGGLNYFYFPSLQFTLPFALTLQLSSSSTPALALPLELAFALTIPETIEQKKTSPQKQNIPHGDYLEDIIPVFYLFCFNVVPTLSFGTLFGQKILDFFPHAHFQKKMLDSRLEDWSAGGLNYKYFPS